MNQQQNTPKYNSKHLTQKAFLKNHSLDFLCYQKRTRKPVENPYNIYTSKKHTSQPKTSTHLSTEKAPTISNPKETLNQPNIKIISIQKHQPIASHQELKQKIQQTQEPLKVNSMVASQQEVNTQKKQQKIICKGEEQVRKEVVDCNLQQKKEIKKSTSCQSEHSDCKVNKQQFYKKVQGRVYKKKTKKQHTYYDSQTDQYQPKNKKKNNEVFSLNKIFYRNKKQMNYEAYFIQANPLYLDFHHLITQLGYFQSILLNLQYAITRNLINQQQAFQLRVDKISKKGFIFMWIKVQRSNVGYQLLNNWGYQVVDQIVHTKIQNGRIKVQQKQLFFNSVQHCLVGYKCPANQKVKYQSKVSNNLLFHFKDHSQKPLYDIIEMITPQLAKIQLFAASKQARRSWVSVGVGQCQQQTKLNKPILIQYNQCSICKTQPIVGPFLKCKQCKNLFICINCFFGKQLLNIKIQYHANSHTLEMNQVNRCKFLKKFKCFYCHNQIENSCFKCRNCFSVNLCASCYLTRKQKEPSSHSHSQKFHSYVRIF